jgi:hypothetical protein
MDRIDEGLGAAMNYRRGREDGWSEGYAQALMDVRDAVAGAYDPRSVVLAAIDALRSNA